MSAHLRAIVVDCEASGCGKKAVVQLYSTRNDPLGRYCRAHGERALKAKLAYDAAYDASSYRHTR